MVSIPRAVVPGIAFVLAGVILAVLSGARLGAGFLAIGVVWIMRTLRAQS